MEDTLSNLKNLGLKLLCSSFNLIDTWNKRLPLEYWKWKETNYRCCRREIFRHPFYPLASLAQRLPLCSEASLQDMVTRFLEFRRLLRPLYRTSSYPCHNDL